MLYEMEGSSFFFVHMQVRNESDRGIGMDLGEDAGRIGPIQYASLDTPVMQVIDIIAPVPPVASDSLASLATAAFDRGELTIIPPGGAADYYADFNAGGRADIDALDARWLMIAYGGWLVATDGGAAEVLAPVDGFIYIPARFPVTWAAVAPD